MRNVAYAVAFGNGMTYRIGVHDRILANRTRPSCNVCSSTHKLTNDVARSTIDATNPNSRLYELASQRPQAYMLCNHQQILLCKSLHNLSATKLQVLHYLQPYHVDNFFQKPLGEKGGCSEKRQHRGSGATNSTWLPPREPHRPRRSQQTGQRQQTRDERGYV